jgi:hypothetical protein
MDEEQVFEKVHSLSFGLYYMCIQPVAHVAYKAIPLVKTCASSNSPTRLCVHLVCHCREASFEALAPQNICWTTLVLELIQGDIYVLPTIVWTILGIFMVFIDASTWWSHVCLMSTRNHAFTTIIRKVIKLHAYYLKSRILSIRMDKVAEFSSCGFIDSHGPGDWSSALCHIHPYSKWFGRIHN